MITKSLMLVYAVSAYCMATLSLLYIMGFLADFGVPKGISDGKQTVLWLDILIDAGLIGLFGLHHSICARKSFKRWWTTIIPAPIERATYLYMTVIMTLVVVLFWQPIPMLIWRFQSDLAVGLMYIAYISVWLMMSAATFHFGHFGFFGLAQVWHNFRNTPPEPTSVSVRYLYTLVRHPISAGWMIAPLLTPSLTVGHLVFATATFAYVLLATPFEEADLIEELGDTYREYRDRVPAFLPAFQPADGRKNTQ